ncbi:MAG: VWA domain-containing protein [Proteobacteria bacterium]|nr:VWA domain-containing protein [Pseudomonadota bacterium]
MNGIRLNHIEMLYLLWALPVLLGLFIYGLHRKKDLLGKFINTGLHHKLLFINPVRSRWKAALILIGFGLLVIGLARPAWNLQETTVKRTGRDVVFVLDVSKSMLAEDLAPNRLERAKLAIGDVVETLQGDRIGLVVFAGSAAVKCPLTLDYGFFRMMLDSVSTNSIDRGGTLIGDAIRTVLDQVLDSQEKQFKDIVLITDGEDHESFPVEAAKEAAAQGVRLLIVGLGDEKEGKRIPVTDGAGRKTFLKYQGREVWTKLDGDTLRRMAKVTPGGKYLPVATGTIDLGEVYIQLIASASKKDLEEETIEKYEEKFQLFLAIAFLLLSLEMVISERKGGKERFRGSKVPRGRG